MEINWLIASKNLIL